jgi:hypothetical protein
VKQPFVLLFPDAESNDHFQIHAWEKLKRLGDTAGDCLSRLKDDTQAGQQST